jgi:hypothetical protein
MRRSGGALASGILGFEWEKGKHLDITQASALKGLNSCAFNPGWVFCIVEEAEGGYLSISFKIGVFARTALSVIISTISVIAQCAASAVRRYRLTPGGGSLVVVAPF